ncbi:hypothetical protein ACLB1R_09080 [Escherichia coli]
MIRRKWKALNIHTENTGGNQHHASDSETGEAADPLIKVNGHHNLTSTSRAGIHLMIDIKTVEKVMPRLSQ